MMFKKNFICKQNLNHHIDLLKVILEEFKSCNSLQHREIVINKQKHTKFVSVKPLKKVLYRRWYTNDRPTKSKINKVLNMDLWHLHNSPVSWAGQALALSWQTGALLNCCLKENYTFDLTAWSGLKLKWNIWCPL